MTKILIEYGKRKKLMALLNTTFPTVRKALNGAEDTELCRKIRRAALENGGVEMNFKPIKSI
jgi:hypothetical protein